MWVAKVQTIVNLDLRLIGADRHSKLLIHLRLEGATPRRLFTVCGERTAGEDIVKPSLQIGFPAQSKIFRATCLDEPQFTQR
jgi:hypothetical protein